MLAWTVILGAAAGKSPLQAHNVHGGRLAGQVCHGGISKSCVNCHAGQGATSFPALKIGLNLRPELPYTYTLLRHVPTTRDMLDRLTNLENTLANFDRIPTWKTATPHSIQRATARSQTCAACHNNPNLFLQLKDLDPNDSRPTARWSHLRRCLFHHGRGGTSIVRRLMLVIAVTLALGTAVPAAAQVPAVQEALLTYLVNIPADFNSIAAPAVKARLDSGEKLYIIDVREETEFAAGHIQGAANVPIRTIPKSLDKLPPKDAAVVVVCKSGMRAAYVTMTLSILGWTNVKDLAFGTTEWEKQGFTMVK